MLRRLYPLVLSFMAVSVQAQTDTIRYQRQAPVIIKIAPLWLIDADPALAGALEVRTGSRTSVQGEFGYGRPGWGSMGSAYQHAGTWRVKTEMRFYRNRYRTNRDHTVHTATTYPLGNYQAIEVYAKVLNVNHSWYYSEPPSGSPVPVPAQPGELRQALIRRNSLSLTYKVGRQFGWTDNRHQGTARLLWDAYLGIGVRLINQTNDGQWAKPGYPSTDGGLFNRFGNDGLSIRPTLALGLKLGFAL